MALKIGELYTTQSRATVRLISNLLYRGQKGYFGIVTAADSAHANVWIEDKSEAKIALAVENSPAEDIIEYTGGRGLGWYRTANGFRAQVLYDLDAEGVMPNTLAGLEISSPIPRPVVWDKLTGRCKEVRSLGANERLAALDLRAPYVGDPSR